MSSYNLCSLWFVPTFRTLIMEMNNLGQKPIRFHAYGVSSAWLGIFYKDFSPNGLKKSPRLVIFVVKEIKKSIQHL